MWAMPKMIALIHIKAEWTNSCLLHMPLESPCGSSLVFISSSTSKFALITGKVTRRPLHLEELYLLINCRMAANLYLLQSTSCQPGRCFSSFGCCRSLLRWAKCPEALSLLSPIHSLCWSWLKNQPAIITADVLYKETSFPPFSFCYRKGTEKERKIKTSSTEDFSHIGCLAPLF